MNLGELHSKCGIELEVVVVYDVVPFIVKVRYQFFDRRGLHILMRFNSKHIQLLLREHIRCYDYRFRSERIISVIIMYMLRIICKKLKIMVITRSQKCIVL